MRTVEEWRGKTDDSQPPPRVEVRVFARFKGRCQCGCTRPICVGESWQTDHIVALVNGGENRENNLQPLLTAHHKAKTRSDVAEKSKVYEVRKKHLGIRKRSQFACSKDSPFKRKIDGTVVRR